MLVRELIECLRKCNSEVEVVFEYSMPVNSCIEYIDHTDPDNSKVSLE